MLSRALGFALLTFVPSLALAEEPSALRERVDKLNVTGRHAYGLYLFDAKVGWMTLDVRLAEENGQPVLVQTTDLKLSAEIFETAVETTSKGKTIYSLKDDGPVLSVEEVSVEEGEKTTVKARRAGKRFVVTREDPDGKRSVTVNPPKANLEQVCAISEWLLKGPEIGDEFREYELELEKAFQTPPTLDDLIVTTYRGKKASRWGGVPVELSQVSLEIQGAVANFELLPNGNWVSGKLGPFKVRMEEEKIAKKLSVVAIGGQESIPVNAKLGEPSSLQSLTLDLIGADVSQIPTTARQKVTSRPGRKVRVEVQRDRPVSDEDAKALTEADRAKYTAATPEYQSDRPKIRDLAVKIADGEDDPLKLAEKLSAWVFENIEGSYCDNASRALAVLKNRAGDCTELTLLFTGLARALDLPARETSGVMYSEDPEPGFYWHQWAEIHDGRQWVTVDPAWNQVFVDAGHLRLQKAPRDLSSIALIGQLEIHVLRSKSSSSSP